MAGEQTISELRAVLAVTGADQVAFELERVNEKSRSVKNSLDEMIRGMSESTIANNKMVAGMSRFGEAAREAAEAASSASVVIKKAFDEIISGMSASTIANDKMIAGMSRFGRSAAEAAREAAREIAVLSDPSRLERMLRTIEFSNLQKTSTGAASGLKGLNAVMAGTADGTQKVGRSTQKMNQIVQQASFGLQDFAITIGQGGLGMALRSASNNAAQIGAIMGGIGGAVAGLGVTFASLIPDIIRMSMGAEKATGKLDIFRESVKMLNEELDRLSKVRRVDIQLEDLNRKKLKDKVEGVFDFRKSERIAKGDAADAEKTLKGFLDREVTKEVRGRTALGLQLKGTAPGKQPGLAGNKELMDALVRERGAQPVVPQAVKTMLGKFPGAVADVERKMREQFAPGGVKEGQLPAQALLRAIATARAGAAGLKGKEKDDFIKDFMETVNDLAAKMRKAKVDAVIYGAAVKKASEMAEAAAQDEHKRQKAVGGAAAKGRENKAKEEEDKKTTKEGEKEFIEFRRSQARAAQEKKRADAEKKRHDKLSIDQQLKDSEAEKKAEMGILEANDPIGAGLRKIQEKFQDFAETGITESLKRNPFDLIGAGAAGLRATAAGGKAQKDFLEKQQPKIEGTFGVADFSRQLQNALLKDDTNKMIQHNTDAIKKSTAESVKRLDDINKGIASLKSAKGVFGP